MGWDSVLESLFILWIHAYENIWKKERERERDEWMSEQTEEKRKEKSSAPSNYSGLFEGGALFQERIVSQDCGDIFPPTREVVRQKL